MGFVNTMAYRLRYYTGIVTYFIYVTVYYFIWKAIYSHSASIEGFDFSHLLTYVAIGWIIRSFYYNNIDQEMATQVLEGKLAMDLIKPVNIQWMYIAQALGESAFRLTMLTVPTAVVLLLVFPVRKPAGVGELRRLSVQRLFEFLPGGGHQLCRGNVCRTLEIHSGIAARQVLSAGTFLRAADSHFILPAYFPADLCLHAFSVHQLHSGAALPGQDQRVRNPEGAGHPDLLGRGPGGHRARAVEFVEQADHDSGRIRQLRITNYRKPSKQIGFYVSS